jgi:hypothetical protein
MPNLLPNDLLPAIIWGKPVNGPVFDMYASKIDPKTLPRTNAKNVIVRLKPKSTGINPIAKSPIVRFAANHNVNNSEGL